MATNNMTSAEIKDKVYRLTLRKMEIQSEKSIVMKDFKDRIGDINDEIDELIHLEEQNNGSTNP